MNITNMTDEELLSYRKEVSRRKAQYGTKQMALKVALNSAYGAIGNEWFRFFDVRIAEAITLSGQLSIRWIETRLNQYFNKLCGTTDEDYVLAVDTDSNYLCLEKLVEKMGLSDAPEEKVVNFLDKACAKIEDFISDQYKELQEYMNAYEQKMFMEREVIASTGFWQAKKRYALLVHDSEGTRYDIPKLKIMGLETKKSSTPQLCRKGLEEAIHLILTKSESDVHEYITNFRKEYEKHNLEEIAFPRGVTDIGKWLDRQTIYKKGTPVHVKGAIHFNRYIKENNLTNRYEEIKDGDKIRFVYLTQPNPIRDSVFAFSSEEPKELKLHEFVDYDKMFETSFMGPLRQLLDSVSWKHEKKNTLEALFA